MFRSSEAAARARIADLERRLGELKEQASDREEEHEKRVLELEAELDRLRRGERPKRKTIPIVIGACCAIGAVVGIAFALRDEPEPPDLETRCITGEAAACLARGYELRPVDAAGAESRFRSACNLGSMEGCGETGWLLMARGDWAGAEPLLLKACEANYLRSCVNLGVILGKRGDPGEEKYARKACDGGDVLGCSNLAGVLDEKGQLHKAIEIANKSCNGGSPFGCADLGWYKLKDKKVQEALQDTTRASQINPQIPKVQINLGYALAADGEVEEAIRRFRRGIELQDKPGNERTFNDKPWGALVRTNLEYLKSVYPDRTKDFEAILGRQREWNP